MKFIDKKVGDEVFIASRNSDTYTSHKVVMVSNDEIMAMDLPYTNNGLRNIDVNKSNGVFGDSFRKHLIFADESDCIRYVKAQGMKTLRSLIKSAKNKIDEVKKYRVEHFSDLNKNWLDEEISILEFHEKNTL